MKEIIYSKNIKKSILKEMNIVIDKNVIIKENVKLGCNVCLLGNTIVESNAVVSINSVIENSIIKDSAEILSSFVYDSTVGANTKVGPFAHLRVGNVVGENCRIGNFVELKNAKLGNNTKVAHLTYVGDAEIGEHCNFGCGVVFCNYNGEVKQKSKIGNFVFVGSNVNIIAPVEIKDYSYIAAGTTITDLVNEGEFVIGRVRQNNKQNFKNPYLNNKKLNKNIKN